MKRNDLEMSLAELSEQSGVPGRTIRFYIARSLLPGPSQAGRGASYGQEHIRQLQEIKELQSKGLTLTEIARSVGRERGKTTLPAPSTWWNYPVDSDVAVWVRADLSPWRLRRIQRALGKLAEQLKTEDTEEEDQ